MVMKKLFTAVVSYIRKSEIYSLYALKRGGQLKDAGWFKSYRAGAPVDYHGFPLPWMTYSAISFLEKRLTSEMSVFEYGSGNSTLWWAEHAKKVVSCEHDKSWYQRMKQLIPSNVELHQIDLEYNGLYSRKIGEFSGAFDIIVIDGRDRNNCAKNSLNALTTKGVIIWDNSERESYREGFDFLLENGFKRLDFDGMGPVNVYAWCTSIFYREKNCFDL